nr:hypothetical protein [Bacillus cereus]
MCSLYYHEAVSIIKNFHNLFSPAISTSNYNNNLIINLTAGNTISLQLFGVLSIVNLVGGGSTGASLTIIRID